MGASSWAYFTPYQPDINQALQELRLKIFKEGAYYKPVGFVRHLYEINIIDDQLLEDVLDTHESESEPKTIQELIKLNSTEGTHSIIDIERVSDTPDFGVVTPLTQEEITDILGTDKPTHELVEQKVAQLSNLRERWEGIYLIVYKNESPDEIFFAGFSGD